MFANDFRCNPETHLLQKRTRRHKIAEHTARRDGTKSQNIPLRASVPPRSKKDSKPAHTNSTVTSRAPCAPITNACSMSAVLEGPEMKTP